MTAVMQDNLNSLQPDWFKSHEMA